jgi:hypothetical protein
MDLTPSPKHRDREPLPTLTSQAHFGNANVITTNRPKARDTLGNVLPRLNRLDAYGRVKACGSLDFGL